MKKKDSSDVLGPIIGFIIIAAIWFGIFAFIDSLDPIDKVKGVLSDRNYNKEMCAERAERASNSYAAKKIYKACMSNY